MRSHKTLAGLAGLALAAGTLVGCGGDSETEAYCDRLERDAEFFEQLDTGDVEPAEFSQIFERFGALAEQAPPEVEEDWAVIDEGFTTLEEAFAEAGHTRRPRVSVSRSVFPVVTEQDALMFGLRSGNGADQIGIIDGMRSTFGRTYVGEPDLLVEQLKEDAAVMSADTLMLTIPSQLGVDLNLHILESFAQHVAPALGWKRNTEGPVVGDPATA